MSAQNKEPIAIRRILFATDFSELSGKAAQYTLALARSLEAEVIVVHAIEELMTSPDDSVDPAISAWCTDLENKMRYQLRRVVASFERHGIRVTSELKWDTPWKMIFSVAQKEPVDLVVVGSHELTRGERQLRLGTTSHKVALGCPVPVLIVRPDGSARAPSSE